MAAPRLVPATPETNPLIVYNVAISNAEVIIPLRKIVAVAFTGNSVSVNVVDGGTYTVPFTDQTGFQAFAGDLQTLLSTLVG